MIDLFDLFAVQGTLQSLLQHHGLKHVYPNVHYSTVYNSQDMEAT